MQLAEFLELPRPEWGFLTFVAIHFERLAVGKDRGSVRYAAFTGGRFKADLETDIADGVPSTVRGLEFVVPDSVLGRPSLWISSSNGHDVVRRK